MTPRKTDQKKLTVITTHVNADFDAMASMLAAQKLYPDSVVNLKIRYDNQDREKVIASAGHSIFNRNCHVNVGSLLSNFEGGGHEKAGACAFHVSKADDYLPKIINALKNDKQET